MTEIASPPPPAPPPKYIVDDGQIWEFISGGGFTGYVPATLVFPKAKPFMRWGGGKISQAVWTQIKAFFEWSMTEFKSEVQVRLYYNRDTTEWAAWAYPQEPDGMTTKELPEHAEYSTQRAQFRGQWVLLGTVHHHCTSSAFQSGTDRHNETSQEGIHVTVGGITSKEYSLHGRIQVRSQEFGDKGEIPWSAWFEIPEGVENLNLPDEVCDTILKYLLKSPPPKDATFPEQWKTNCIPPKRVATTTYYGKTGAAAAASGGNGPRTYVVKTDLRSEFTAAQLEFMREARVYMTEAKLGHNEADTLIASELGKLNAGDRIWAEGIFAMGKKVGLDEAVVDRLFDQWDFATVLDTLDKPPVQLPLTTP